MAKFMLLYRDPSEAAAPPSPEEMQAFLGLWGEWFQKFEGKILDGGDALLPTGRVIEGDQVHNGPYVEAKEIIGGYSVVEAPHYEAAIEIARECPIAKIGLRIEIREFAGYA